MNERDEEGRPVATKNAGAFMPPPPSGGGGMYAVPSSVIDQRGASVEHPSEADVERRGTRVSVPEEGDQRSVSERQRWTYAVVTATAVWALGFALLQLVLDGSQDWAGKPVSGTQVLPLLHTDVARLVLYLAFLGIGLRIGAGFLASRSGRSMSVLAGATIVGAVAVAWIIMAQGGAAGAIILITCALAWLAMAYQIRPA